VKQAIFVSGLSILYYRLGRPVWYWPAVMFVLFGVLPLAASALENL